MLIEPERRLAAQIGVEGVRGDERLDRPDSDAETVRGGIRGKAVCVADGAWPQSVPRVGDAEKIHDVLAADELLEIWGARIGMTSYKTDEAPPRRGSVFSRGAC